MSRLRVIIDKLINHYQLEKHMEGGHYFRSHRSTQQVKSVDNNGQAFGRLKSAYLQIYYLLSDNEFSAWHRVKSDETWHYYAGCNATLHIITPVGEYHSVIIGDYLLDNNAHYQYTVLAGHWFACELNESDKFAFFGCNMGPGFELEDFELGQRQHLLATFPQHENIIKRLTREVVA